MALLLLGCALTTGCQAPPDPAPHEFIERHMGCTARILIATPDTEGARAAARAAFDVIAQCDAELSDYRPDNAVAELARKAGTDAPVIVGPLLLATLTRALAISQATAGAFDVTAGPLVRLWRTARKTGVLPDPIELEHARSLVGWQSIEVDAEHHTVRLPRAGMSLDFGAIGKGFAADRALEVLRKSGFPCALVGIEGDLALGDPPPGRKGWRIAATTDNPRAADILELSNCGVSTSGDTTQFVEIGGVRYSHIVDPRSGRASTYPGRTTVIRPDTTEADAFATAISVLKCDEAGLSSPQIPNSSSPASRLGSHPVVSP